MNHVNKAFEAASAAQWGITAGSSCEQDHDAESNLIDEAVAGYEFVLNDLRERLQGAEKELLGMLKAAKEYAADNPRAQHLSSKLAGVRLALGYLEEYLR